MSTRAKELKPMDEERFMKLDEDKRERILNAAMKEFRYGYKKASTDRIVKEAGISKGLLFHYFGTKEQLFCFMLKHASDYFQEHYLNLLAIKGQDILESFMNVANAKKNMLNRYPYLFECVNSVNTHWADLPAEVQGLILQGQDEIDEEFYKSCNTDMFRDDIDHKKAIDVIIGTMDALLHEETVRAASAGGWDEKNHKQFQEALGGYLELFKKTFFKQET